MSYSRFSRLHSAFSWNFEGTLLSCSFKKSIVLLIFIPPYSSLQNNLCQIHHFLLDIPTSVQLVKFYPGMLLVLHRPSQLYSTAGSNIYIWFRPNVYVLSQLSCFWRSQFRAFCRVGSMLYDSVTSKGLNSVSNSSV